MEKTPSTGALPPVCIAIGGGFDKLLGRYWPAQTVRILVNFHLVGFLKIHSFLFGIISQTTAKPSSVGLTLGLEKLISLMSSERWNFFLFLEGKVWFCFLFFVDFGLRSDDSTEKQILVCSRGGGGLLKERMELTGKLWQAGLKVISTFSLLSYCFCYPNRFLWQQILFCVMAFCWIPGSICSFCLTKSHRAIWIRPWKRN